MDYMIKGKEFALRFSLTWGWNYSTFENLVLTETKEANKYKLASFSPRSMIVVT